MGKGKLTALLLAIIVVMAVALVRTATASHTTTHKAFSGGSGFKGLVAKSDSNSTSVTALDPDWQTVDSRGFQLPAGESQLVVVDFSAEVLCLGTETWCSVRAVIGETVESAVELEPASGGDFAFDTVGDDLWEGNAMSRFLCARNPAGVAVNVSVWLQARKASVNVSLFNLDDWAFKIARNTPCSPTVDVIS